MSSGNQTKAAKRQPGIRRRITAYYAVVLFVFVLIAALLLFFASQTYIRHTARQDLSDAVENGFDEIRYRNDVITINEDYDTYYRGVSLILYGEDGARIKGVLPHDFPTAVALEAGEYKEVDGDNETWLVYDAYHVYENGKVLWIRGIYNMENRNSAFAPMGWIIAGLLPLILLIALYAGSRLTQQALRPVMEMTETAERIQGGDLAERIPVSDRRDELQYLSLTLNDMLQRLEDAFQNEKQFSADAAHELKTPVATILAECEFALKQGETVSPEEANLVYEDSLEQIQTQCRRMMTLITQLLQLSRTMNTTDLLEKEPFDLSLLIDGIVEEMAGMAEEQHVRLEKDLAEDVMLEGDETLIMRMLMNLISNGIKYSKAAGSEGGESDSYVRVSLKRETGGLEQSDSEQQDWIVIGVQDNGIGISEENLEKVFHRLYKVDQSRNSDGNSFGIGLSMVKWIAEAHGGSVALESTLGEGSTFTVRLPA